MLWEGRGAFRLSAPAWKEHAYLSCHFFSLLRILNKHCVKTAPILNNNDFLLTEEIPAFIACIYDSLRANKRLHKMFATDAMQQ